MFFNANGNNLLCHEELRYPSFTGNKSFRLQTKTFEKFTDVMSERSPPPNIKKIVDHRYHYSFVDLTTCSCLQFSATYKRIIYLFSCRSIVIFKVRRI